MSWSGTTRTSSRRRRGASAVEYLTVIVLVSITALSSWRLLGKSVRCRISAGTRALAGLSADSANAGKDDECDDGAPELPPPSSNGNGSPSPAPGITCVGTVCGQAGAQCFVAGTLVLTESGPRAIETIPVGARVWSRDQDGDREDWKTVVQTYARTSRSLVELTVANDAGDEEIFRLTPNHLVDTRPRGWVEVGTLDPERDTLVDDSDAALRVRAIAAVAEEVPVFNLEVEDFHTYFVGDARVWVHNGLGDKLKFKGKGRSQVGTRVPITIPPGASPLFPEGATGQGLVISEDGHGNSEFEASIGGQRISGTIGPNGAVTVASEPGKRPYRPGSTINGMPVTTDPDGTVHVGNNIVIHPPEDNGRNSGFVSGVLTDLNTIASTPSGSRLLHSIDTNGGPTASPVDIRYGNGFGAGGRPQSNPTGTDPKFSPGSPGRVGSGGSGSITMTTPNQSGVGLYSGDDDPNLSKTHPVNIGQHDSLVLDAYQQGWGRAKNKPTDIALYHELVHADDSRRGLTEQRTIPAPRPPKKIFRKQPPRPTTIDVGEERSVGLGSFANTPYNENTYRDERGVPQRSFYNNPKEVYSTDEQRGYTVPSYVAGDPRLPSHSPATPAANVAATTPPPASNGGTNAPEPTGEDPSTTPPPSPTTGGGSNDKGDGKCG